MQQYGHNTINIVDRKLLRYIVRAIPFVLDEKLQRVNLKYLSLRVIKKKKQVFLLHAGTSDIFYMSYGYWIIY